MFPHSFGVTAKRHRGRAPLNMPSGFRVSGVRCGLKEKGLDLGLIVSLSPATSSCAGTTNKLKAPSVALTEKNVKKGKIQAVVVNSGNANCATPSSYRDTQEIILHLSKKLKINPSYVAIAQTGVIGKKLPVEKIIKNIPELIKNLGDDTSSFCSAILTTDKVKKEILKNIIIDNKNVTLYGCAKGSGMIAPSLATMLVFILTDINITKKMLDSALKHGVSKSFNLITVDGCTSTNDLIIILANGKAKNRTIDRNNKTYKVFRNMLFFTCLHLAKEIVRDGEGATKLIEVLVSGGKSTESLEKVAKSVANSNLVKTAIFGGDPNWGRILSAVGASAVDLDINKVDIYFDDLKIAEDGCGVKFDEQKAKEILNKDEFKITVDLKSGKKSITVYTCDLSYDYVKINAEYHT